MGGTADRRRRAVARAAAVVAAVPLAGCGMPGEDSKEATGPSYEPVETTSTTEPSPTSSATSAGGAPEPVLPKASELLDRAKQRMGASSTVTIDGTLVLEGDVAVDLHSEGSTGGVLTSEEHAGASRSTLTLDNGGTLEVRALGWYHYFRADEKWFEGVRTADRKMARHADRWVQVEREDSPVNDLRPNRMIKGSFFGRELDQFDAAAASVTTERLDGAWVYRLDLGPAGEGARVPRTMWVSADDSAEMLRLTFGQHPNRFTYAFSEWNDTSEDVQEPSGAKQLEDDQVGDLL